MTSIKRAAEFAKPQHQADLSTDEMRAILACASPAGFIVVED